MTRTAIQPASLRDPRPRFTTAWKVDTTIYVAGQTASEEQGVAGPGDIRVQTRTAFERIRTILEAAGASMRDVVKTTVYVTDMRYREGYNEVRQEFWATDPPASTLVQVVALATPEALIEIDVIAVVG
ncbi:MAG TPA: RidA family protein [Chloroflexota bacterium]|jgi:enamine deaminase RidA (YjgF/YER057c/UK114 family)